MQRKNRDRILFQVSDNINIQQYQLEKIEGILNNLNIWKKINIIDIIEFYNIKLFFDKNIFLSSWNGKKVETFSKEIKILDKKIIDFFKNINSWNILKIIKELDAPGIRVEYKLYFWELIDKYKTYKNIEEKDIQKILKYKSFYVEYIMLHKEIVEYFKKYIRKFLLDYENFANMLLDHHYKEECYKFDILEFTDEEKNNAIGKYIKEDNYNLNLRKIYDIKDWFLKISDDIKLLAKKTENCRIENYFDKNNWQNIKFIISIKNQEKYIITNTKKEWNKLIMEIKYSKELFNKENLINAFPKMFIEIFNFIDNNLLIDLVNKKVENSELDLIFKNNIDGDYLKNSHFDYKDIISLLNLNVFLYELKENWLTIEYLINEYIKKISKFKWLEKLEFNLKESDIEYNEKINILMSKLDYLIKQYKCFVEKGSIDFELIKISSKPIKFEEIPSILENKYFYEKDWKLEKLKNIFFKTNFFIKTWSKTDNLFNLLSSKNLRINNFSNYEKDIINQLISEKDLYIDKDNFIRIKDYIYIWIIWEFLKWDWIISYHLYNELGKNKIIDMSNNDLVYPETKLLSKSEVEYFNYYLNKKFVNWLDIRNKNIHWNLYESKKEGYYDYIKVIRILILFLIKIDIELRINEELNLTTN